MNTDKYEKLKSEIREFNSERDWEQFHTPKDVAISLSLEASELLECFQWMNDAEVQKAIASDSKLGAMKDEIGDIGNYLIVMCDLLGIDVLDAIADKLQKNKIKYPADKCRGKADKYTSYESDN